MWNTFVTGFELKDKQLTLCPTAVKRCPHHGGGLTTLLGQYCPLPRVKGSIYYNSSTLPDKIFEEILIIVLLTVNTGFVDLGTEANYDDNALEATNALVFMVVSLNSSWKLPVAYFFVTTLSGSMCGQDDDAHSVKGTVA